MDGVKRLVQVSWWEGLAVGKPGSCSGGQGHAQYIFNPIFCWWVRLFVVWPGAALSWSLQAMVGLGWPSVGLIPIHASQDCYCPFPCPQSRPLTTDASTRDPQTLTGRSGSVSCGVTAAFTWFLVHARFYCAVQESLFPLVLWNFCNQSHCPPESDSLWIPSLFVGSQGWEAWCGA